MGSLIYFTIASLDGFIEDAEGRFEWAAPDEEVHAFTNELERSVGTELYGRRMYEIMLFWETAPADDSVPAVFREFAEAWRAADKIVFSRTLKSASSGNTRIERDFTPDMVERLKRSSQRDLTVSGAELAGQAIKAGLVDELQLLIVPKIVGGGKPWLPKTVHVDLELLETRRFASGFVFLRYRPKPAIRS